MTAPLSISVDNILRNSDSLETIARASPDSSIEVSGNEKEGQESQPLSDSMELFAEQFPRPSDLYLGRLYDQIMAKPGPARAKRRRIQELLNNNSSIESSPENSGEALPETDLNRLQPGYKQRDRVIIPQDSPPATSKVPSSTSLNRQNVIPSSVESNENLALPERAGLSPESSRRRDRRSRSDGSVHSNGSAPRRINIVTHTGANNRGTARTVNVKNFGG